MEKEELGFVVTRPISCFISRLEEVGKKYDFNYQKSDSKVRLQGQESGRKEKLAIGTNIFVVTPSFFVVEVKKDNINTL